MANTPSQARKDDLRTGQSGAGHSTGAGSTSSMAERAKDLASSATQSASDLASAAGQRAREATSSVASGIQSAAHTLRQNLPHEGMMGRASSAVADTLESSGRYLQEEGFSGMMEDLSGVIRRNPIPAVLVGIGVGFLLGRTLRS